MTFALDVAIILAVAVGLLGGCGILLLPLLPARARPWLPVLAPFFGLAVISAVCHALGAAGLSLAAMVWPLIGLAAAGWTAGLVRATGGWPRGLKQRSRTGVGGLRSIGSPPATPRSPSLPSGGEGDAPTPDARTSFVLVRRPWRRPRRARVEVLAVCLLAFVLATLPLFSLGYLTTVGGASDAISYTERAEYLQHAGLRLPQAAPGQAFLAGVQSHVMTIRAGDAYLLGLLSLATRHRSFELLTLLAALFFALTPATVFVWARLSLRLGRGPSLLAASLVAINNLLLWPVLDDFLSQVIALSLFPLLLVFGIEGWHRRGWRTAAAFGILTVTLASVYPVYAAYAVVALLAAWLVEWMRARDWRDLPRCAWWWLTMAGCAAAANPVALQRAGKEMSLVSKLLQPLGARFVGPGDIIVFPTLSEIPGVASHLAASLGWRLWSLPRGTTSILGLVAAGFAAYGWRKLPPRSRVPAGILVLVSAALAAQQRYGVNLPYGYPYGYFKAVSVVPLEALALLAAGLAAAWRRPPVLRAAACLGGAAIVVLNLMNTAWSLDFTRRNLVVVTRELIAVARGTAAVPPADRILVGGMAAPLPSWIAYFCKDRLIHYADDALPGPHVPFFRWALLDRQRETGLQRAGGTWNDPAQYQVAWQNARFSLRRRSDAALAVVRFAEPVLGRGEVLKLKLAPERGVLEADLGGRPTEVELASGIPRRAQIDLWSAGSTSPQLAADGVAPFALGVGGWRLDLDLERLPDPRRIALRNLGGTSILVSELKVLSTGPGRPRQSPALTRLTRLEQGIVYVEQETGALPRITYRATLLTPEAAGKRFYTLGIFAASVATGHAYGAWSLEFAAGKRWQSGSLEIDLHDGQAHAEIDGRPVTAGAGMFDFAGGSFALSSVIWQGNPVVQVSVDNLLWFSRDLHGSIAIVTSSPRALTLISPR
ncbi:MAG TPA: hypothetical protein VHQ90_01515 [Thermoanaerobaculia bacterium]|nr:hypothetical protein [Thermoanaerobaculia bacterium]